MSAEKRRVWSARTGLGRALLIAVAVIASARPAASQVFQVQAGSSSLFGAHGGSIEARSRSVSVTAGAGEFHDELTVGARLQKTYKGILFSAGDSLVDFQLPTDLFGGGRYVPVRGAGVDLKRGGARWRGFAGTTSDRVGTPFFQGGDWGRAIGMLFVDLPRGSRWLFASRNAFTTRPTSIQSVEWRPHESFKLAGSGGVGSGHPYFSSSVHIDGGWATANAGYTTRDAGFRRLDATSPMASEVEGENVSLTLRPRPDWSVNATRQHLVDAEPSQAESKRATVNQLGANLNVGATRFGGGIFESHREQVRNLGLTASVGRHVLQSLDLAADYYRSASADGAIANSVVGRVQESVHPRVSLLQVVTRNDDQTSFDLGGQFLSNLVTVGVGYQTSYAPFHVGNPFVQTLALDLRLQVRGFQLQLGTYAAPNGRLRYTVTGNRTLSTGEGTGGRAQKITFAKYLVRGSVRDENGRPVAGAVIRIGAEIAMTSEDGRYFVRFAKPAKTPFTVLTEEFATGRFEVVSAPTSVKPALENLAPDIDVIVRRT